MAIGSGRQAWITGGSSGIGAAVASLLLAEGADVAVLDIREPASDQVVWQRVDLADRVAVADGLRTLAATTAWPDIVVLSAGTTGHSPFAGYPLELWDRLQAVNLTGPLMILRDTFPHMCQRRYGRIVAISSGTAVAPGPGTAGYAASKAGLIALMKVAAIEGALAGVTANTVAPGLTDTPMTRGGVQGIDELRRLAAESHLANPQQAVLAPEEIATAVVFLCSDESGRITGQTLHVNGGRIMP